MITGISYQVMMTDLRNHACFYVNNEVKDTIIETGAKNISP